MIRSKCRNNIRKAFLEASKSGQDKIINLLLESLPDSNKENTLNIGLCLAVKNGRLSTARKLLAKGAKVNCQTNFGNPISLAAKIQSSEIRNQMTKFLIRKGADVSAGKNYALCAAAAKGHTDTLELLLNEGADIHAQGELPLLTSVFNGHLTSIKILLNKGADPYANDRLAIKIAETKARGGSKTNKRILEILKSNPA